MWGGASRELMKAKERPEPSVHPLTIQQVGLGQSRGYLMVRELPEGSPVSKWVVLKEDKLWLFDAADSQRTGQHISLEKALVHEVAGGTSRSADQLSTFEVRTKRGRAYLFKAKSSGDALNWMRAMKLHTAKETENQILDRAERLVCLGELASSARIQQQARKLRRMAASLRGEEGRRSGEGVGGLPPEGG